MRTPHINSYRYVPINAPIDINDVPRWASVEFRNIKSAFDASNNMETLAVAPIRPRNGDLAYADGTNWNPHSGGGMYLYISSGWGKVITSNSSGNVGIGTTSPSYRLHVSASASVVAMLETTAAASDNVQLRFKGVSGERWAIGNNVSTGGTGLNFDFYDLASNTNRLRIDATGNVVVGSAALATNATGGFHWIPSCAGTPTGSPTAPYTNAAAMVVDTTNSKLYVRVGAAWKSVTLT